MKNNLKELRIQAGYTQDELAEKLGTSKPYISQLENGKRDIKTIRKSTMQKICEVLHCTASDLIPFVEFKFTEDGKLLIDAGYNDIRFPNDYIIVIDGTVFALPLGRRADSGEQVVKSLRILPFYDLEKANKQPLRNYQYIGLHCIPKQGIEIPLGRAITDAEFKELCDTYSLTEDDISSEFEDAKGMVYGKEFAKTYTCVQVKIEKENPIQIERMLKEKGIEANNISPTRINIRVK